MKPSFDLRQTQRDINITDQIDTSVSWKPNLYFIIGIIMLIMVFLFFCGLVYYSIVQS